MGSAYWQQISDIQASVEFYAKFISGGTDYTLCLEKNLPDVFSYNSRKHCRIFVIFGRNITKRASNQKILYFSTSPD